MSNGIYVKGLGVPNSCYECFFLFYHNGSSLCSIELKKIKLKAGYKKPEWCPLVETDVVPCSEVIALAEKQEKLGYIQTGCTLRKLSEQYENGGEENDADG